MARSTRAASFAKQALQNIAEGAADPQTPRQAILDEASELTHQSRNTAYGNPEDNFRNIANLWNAYLQAKGPGICVGDMPCLSVSVHDVAVMMILMKTARLATNPNHHDSCVDIAGYAACLGDVQAAGRPQESVAVGVKYSTDETNERTLQRRK